MVPDSMWLVAFALVLALRVIGMLARELVRATRREADR